MKLKTWTPKMKTSDRLWENTVTPLRSVRRRLKVLSGNSSREKLPHHWRRGLSLHSNANKKHNVVDKNSKFRHSKSNSTLTNCQVYHCSPIFEPRKRKMEEQRRITRRRVEQSDDFLSKTSLYDLVKEAERQLTQEIRRKTSLNLMNMAFCESEEEHIYEDVDITDTQDEDIYEDMELHRTFVINNSNHYMKMKSTDV